MASATVIPLPVNDARDQTVRYLAKGGGAVIEFPRRKPACQGLQSPTNLEMLAREPVQLLDEILQVLTRSRFLREHYHDVLQLDSPCPQSMEQPTWENPPIRKGKLSENTDPAA